MAYPSGPQGEGVRGMARLASRYFWTGRYLRPSQYYHRLSHALRFFLYRYESGIYARLLEPRGAPPLAAGSWVGQNDLKARDVDATAKDRADRVVSGKFEFLNHTRCFPDLVDWHSNRPDRLWRFHLHYFDYATDLGLAYRQTRSETYYCRFRQLTSDWVRRNPPGSLDAWHPYPLSLRIVNWIRSWHLFYPLISEDQSAQSMFLRSLYGQCRFLLNHTEFQHRGNHLMANLNALIAGGCFFSGEEPAKWVTQSVWLLRRELSEQVLADGGHFERSTMYHTLVLRDLLVCLAFLRLSGRTVAGFGDTVNRMRLFAQGMTTPDGRFPLVNDATQDGAPNPRTVLENARTLLGRPTSAELQAMILGVDEVSSKARHESVSASFPASGYYVMRSENAVLFIDCGSPCPDYLPAHAHADTLSYELWVGGAPVVSDSGTYTYTPGPWRDFFRSTRAHNTVVLNGLDQSDVWASFRVGRRARPRDVVWIETDEVIYFAGAHTGYSHLKSAAIHRRRILHVKDRFWLIVDEMRGRGRHEAESYVHFHPGVSLRSSRDWTWHTHLGGTTLSLLAFGFEDASTACGESDPIQGWHAAEFGVRHPRQTLRLTKTGKLPLTFGYLMMPGSICRADPAVRLTEDKERFEVTVEDTVWSVDVFPNQARLRWHAETADLKRISD